MSKKKESIGFIGTGVMGKSMIRNLISAGYPVKIYSRTKSKAEDLLSEGAIWHNSPQELVEDCEIIITMVGYPADVEEIYVGREGIINLAKSDTIFIDMTTSSPKLAQRIEQEAKKNQCHSIDAPVSGGDVGAKEGTLSIMVGGDKEVFNNVEAIFKVMGTNIVYQGTAGSGQHTKMCNQIAIASNMMGVCEAIMYAQKSGLDSNSVMKSIESGAAGSWSLSNLGPRIIKEDYNPGFYVKHFIKDMKIALDSADEMGLKTPGLRLTLSLYEELAKKGGEDNGTQALYKLYKKTMMT